MSPILWALISITLCAALTSAAADPAPLHSNGGEEVHSAVTDVPKMIDMSHADPKTWSGLPAATQLEEQSPAVTSGNEELRFPVQQPTVALTIHGLF
jgi:hypothetical protein